jgi:AraC family transcriptional regulator
MWIQDRPQARKPAIQQTRRSCATGVAFGGDWLQCNRVTLSAPTATAKGNCWILHERGRQYYWKGKGQLSIKTFSGGRAQYQVGSGHHAVDESSYLVLNEGQTYSINLESRQPVESFCVFFAAGFVEEVQRSLSSRPERLLDDPFVGESPPIHFFEKNYSHDRVLSPALMRLRRGYAREEGRRLMEALHDIAERLLKVHELACEETKCLRNVRVATREELYRRVCRGRDYAAALFAEPVTLPEMARVACLSPNHFLRTFREAFGETPHQFLRARRLAEARRLLAQSEMPVTEVCLAVGFESLGSFSTLFAKRFGVSPVEYRRRKK